jgi:membrane protease YdiL (CAAX protease family)
MPIETPDPQPNSDIFLPATDAPVSVPAPAETKPAAIAPVWHTLLVTALILGNSFLGSSKLQGVGSGHGSRLLLYGGTFITELVLFLLIWFGIRLRGVRMRDLISGRWKTVESFLLDVGLAVGFLIVSLLLLFVLRVALGLIDFHNLAKSQEETMKVLGPLAPHSYLEAAFFVCLSISAGLFEEIIFRGYLQRQFHALANSAVIGIIASGIIFGLAHGYQGARNMVVIAFFGVFFGILAYLRKSLRPGMIAHGLQDSIAGIALFLLVRRH